MTYANAINLPAPSTSGNVLTSNGTSWTSAAPAGGGDTWVGQVFTSNGTYTPTPGMKYCWVRMVGGGGGGAGCGIQNISTIQGGGGGAAGEYAEGLFSSATIGASQSVTIGNGGNGGVGNNNGSSGGTTSLGSILTALGGSGGIKGVTVSSSAIYFGEYSSGGTGGTGGSFRSSGQPGFPPSYQAGNYQNTGAGGNSVFGGAAKGLGSSDGVRNGFNATGYGSGGSGSFNYNAAANNGGSGSNGIIVILELI
jgi:hypothetical protein